MYKQTSQGTRSVILVAITIVIMLGAAPAVFAQKGPSAKSQKQPGRAAPTKEIVEKGHLLQQGAAQGATLYRYKVDTFLLCLRNADETVDRTESQEQYFQCFKSKSGEWECTENGRRSWDHRIVRAR